MGSSGVHATLEGKAAVDLSSLLSRFLENIVFRKNVGRGPDHVGLPGNAGWSTAYSLGPATRLLRTLLGQHDPTPGNCFRAKCASLEVQSCACESPCPHTICAVTMELPDDPSLPSWATSQACKLGEAAGRGRLGPPAHLCASAPFPLVSSCVCASAVA